MLFLKVDKLGWDLGPEGRVLCMNAQLFYHHQVKECYAIWLVCTLRKSNDDGQQQSRDDFIQFIGEQQAHSSPHQFIIGLFTQITANIDILPD